MQPNLFLSNIWQRGKHGNDAYEASWPLVPVVPQTTLGLLVVTPHQRPLGGMVKMSEGLSTPGSPFCLRRYRA